jgi:hypothetical protein
VVGIELRMEDSMDRRSFIAGGGSLFALTSTAVPAPLSQGLLGNTGSPRRTKVMSKSSEVPLTTVHHVEADGVNMFYRETGPADAGAAVARLPYFVVSISRADSTAGG